MLSRLIRYIRGYLRIRVQGIYAERFLNACGQRNICLWDIRPVSGAYEMNISIPGFRKLKPIIRKTGTKAVIVKRFGLPFYLQKYRRRKAFFAGAVLCLCLLWLFSGLLWNVEIRGNLTYTEEDLLEFLKSDHVYPGIRVSQVDCADIARDIRREYEEIIWVSASLEGTRLLIRVKENETGLSQEGKTQQSREETEPVDLVAKEDGVITSMIVREGVAQVEEGQEVKKGDVLVSGQVPVKNDAGEVTGFQYHVSDADILARTKIFYEDPMSLTWEEKKDLPVEKTQYFLKIGRLRFSLGLMDHPYPKFRSESRQWQGRIFGNFYLPVSWGVQTLRPYESLKKAYTKSQIRTLLSVRFSGYCEDLEKKGVEIIENDVKIYTGSKEARAQGTLTVLMPVGEAKPAVKTEIPLQEQSGEDADGNDGSSN